MTEFRVVEGADLPSLSLPGTKVVVAKENGDLYALEVETTQPMTVCPKCGVVGDLIRFSKLQQKFSDTPIHGKACKATSLEPLEWAYFKHRATNAYTGRMNRIIRDIDRSGRGYSFPALRAKVLYGQEFRKRDKLASRAKMARDAFMGRELPDSLVLPMMALGSGEYGADMHRVAEYLTERAKQHERQLPPT